MSKVQVSPKQLTFLKSNSSVVVFNAGIGSGKTVIAAEKCVQLILLGGYVLVMASTYKQLKQVLFQEIINRLRLHEIEFEVNQSDMTIDVNASGGRVFGYSSESIESVRGITVDCIILDEAALMTHYDYKVASGRSRRGHLPRQTFITTTPRGRDNWVYELSQLDYVDLIHQTTFENPFLPKDFLEGIAREYSGDLARQELMGEFLASSDEMQFISTQSVFKAMERVVAPYEDSDEPIVYGLDVARFGKDKSILLQRQGRKIVNVWEYDNLSIDQLKDEVVNIITENGGGYLVVDAAGLGAGLFDILKKEVGKVINCVEFNGAFKASDANKYANLRAESFGRLREWIENAGGQLNEKVQYLTQFRFKLNNRGQILLESKVDLKARTGKSPDVEDALSMTFSIDAKKKDKVRTKQSYRPQYNVFAG